MGEIRSGEIAEYPLTLGSLMGMMPSQVCLVFTLEIHEYEQEVHTSLTMAMDEDCLLCFWRLLRRCTLTCTWRLMSMPCLHFGDC